MNKILKLKDFLTVEDAAKHLSDDLKDVSLADLYRFVLDKHLTMSARFINQAYAQPGQYVCNQDNENNDLVFDNPVQAINGIRDLAMIGREAQEIEVLYQKEVGGPEPDFTGLNGFFLREGELFYKLQRSLLLDSSEESQNVVLARLDSLLKPKGLTIDDIAKPDDSLVLDSLNDVELEEFMDLSSMLIHCESGENEESATYLPLDEDCYQFVVRTDELIRFIGSLQDEDEATTQCNRQYFSTDRNIHLVIIGRMLAKAKFDPSVRGIASSVRGYLEQAGVILSHDTIYKVITKRLQEAHESPKKCDKPYSPKERSSHLAFIGGMLINAKFDFSSRDIISAVKAYLELDDVILSDDTTVEILAEVELELEKREKY